MRITVNKITMSKIESDVTVVISILISIGVQDILNRERYLIQELK